MFISADRRPLTPSSGSSRRLRTAGARTSASGTRVDGLLPTKRAASTVPLPISAVRPPSRHTRLTSRRRVSCRSKSSRCSEEIRPPLVSNRAEPRTRRSPASMSSRLSASGRAPSMSRDSSARPSTPGALAHDVKGRENRLDFKRSDTSSRPPLPCRCSNCNELDTGPSTNALFMRTSSRRPPKAISTSSKLRVRFSGKRTLASTEAAPSDSVGRTPNGSGQQLAGRQLTRTS
jgi:hypothetical protein